MIRAKFARQGFNAGNVGSSEAMTSNCGTAEIVSSGFNVVGKLVSGVTELRSGTLHSSLQADLDDLSISSEQDAVGGGGYWNLHC